MLNIDRIPSEEEVNYYSMLKIFNDDYVLFRDALIDLGKIHIKQKALLRIIEDIRFYDSGSKKRNYDTISEAMEVLLDTKMQVIKKYKNKHNKQESYIDKLFSR